MNLVRKAVFTHEIKHDPESEDEGTIIIKTRIFGEYDTLTNTATSFIEEFIDEDNDECQSRQAVNYFLMEANIDDDIISDAMIRLILYVDEVTSSASNEFSSGCALNVWMDFLPYDLGNTEIEEAVRVSFDQTDSIRFRPASKLVVKSLTKKLYNKTSSRVGDKCIVCLEEFNNGTRVVYLPCGHDFDHECIVKWFETSHICPLCRFELPCENHQ